MTTCSAICLTKDFRGGIGHVSHHAGQVTVPPDFLVAKPAKPFCSVCVVFLSWTGITNAHRLSHNKHANYGATSKGKITPPPKSIHYCQNGCHNPTIGVA